VSVKIGGLQRISLNDYPGRICATVFIQGCNFRCPYCHNPELVDPDRYGPLIPEEEVLSFLDKRRGRLEAVTVTGGEPTLQKGLGGFLTAVKEMKYLVKLDTNGSDPEALYALIAGKLIDYIAMDVKGPLERYDAIVSVKVDGSRINQSIGLIIDSGIAHEFRTTVVRSQLAIDDFPLIAERIKGGRLYVLQPFVGKRTLDDAFHSEASYTLDELSSIRDILERKGVRVVVRCG